MKTKAKVLKTNKIDWFRVKIMDLRWNFNKKQTKVTERRFDNRIVNW